MDNNNKKEPVQTVKRIVGSSSEILIVETKSGLKLTLWNDVQLGREEADLDEAKLLSSIDSFLDGHINELTLRACMQVDSFVTLSYDDKTYRMSTSTLVDTRNVCGISVPVSAAEMYELLTNMRSFLIK